MPEFALAQKPPGRRFIAAALARRMKLPQSAQVLHMQRFSYRVASPCAMVSSPADSRAVTRE
jgi:hypothetical protein